jgi:transcriptional regulator with XRE-family HTH domain
MKTMLAENIRRFRKERSLTQEQLSEVLGVTPGAVYKWEAKLSVPDIELIIQMADFFDTSVDVLLGYELKDNRLEATVRRLREYRRQKDAAGLAEAEKALKKYPHSLRIVNESAALNGVFGFETGDKKLLRRSLELFENCLLLLPENTDPQISEQTVCGRMALVYLGLDEPDKGIDLMKKHNAGGAFSHKIGQILAYDDRTEEAIPFLSEAMSKIIDDLTAVVLGYVNVFDKRGDFASCRAILELGIGFFSGLSDEGKPCFLDKLNCLLLPALAHAQLQLGMTDAARGSLMRAKALAEAFDRAPSYDESDIRFITRIEGSSVYDDIGATAMETIGNALIDINDEKLTELWKSVSESDE